MTNEQLKPLRILLLDWLYRGTELEKHSNDILRRLEEMAATLDDLATLASDIRDTLNQLPEKLTLIESRLDDIKPGEPLEQAKLDAVYDALSEVKTLASQALSTADSLDGEDGA